MLLISISAPVRGISMPITPRSLIGARFLPFSRASAFTFISSSCSRVQIMAEPMADPRGVHCLALLDLRLPLAQFLGGLALVRAEFSGHRDHSGSIRVTSRSASLPLQSAAQQTNGTAGDVGHLPPPLIEQPVESIAQPIPAFLERLDARVARADLEGDHLRRNGFLQLSRIREQTMSNQFAHLHGWSWHRLCSGRQPLGFGQTTPWSFFDTGATPLYRNF